MLQRALTLLMGLHERCGTLSVLTKNNVSMDVVRMIGEHCLRKTLSDIHISRKLYGPFYTTLDDIKNVEISHITLSEFCVTICARKRCTPQKGLLHLHIPWMEIENVRYDLVTDADKTLWDLGCRGPRCDVVVWIKYP